MKLKSAQKKKLECDLKQFRHYQQINDDFIAEWKRCGLAKRLKNSLDTADWMKEKIENIETVLAG